jgi:hypothetical protein
MIDLKALEKFTELQQKDVTENLIPIASKDNLLYGVFDMSFIPDLNDYVIESVVNSDGSWYRKWKSGWLEQGGKSDSIPGSGPGSVNLLVPFTNALYNVQATIIRKDVLSTQPVIVFDFSTTSFSVDYQSLNITQPVMWYAYGMGA